MRKTIQSWIREGKTARCERWLYDVNMQAQKCKLTLTLPDRTLRWKLLLVTIPTFNRLVAFSPSVPEVAFEVGSRSDLEECAVETYSKWVQKKIKSHEFDVDDISENGQMWLESLQIEIDDTISLKSPSANIFAALFGGDKMSGQEELHAVGRCLDNESENFEVAIGRDATIDEISRILTREDRQGVLIVGPPAVGKTAIVHACVKQRMDMWQNKKGPRPQVWHLSPQRLVSGMSYLGQWEQRWLAILKEATKRDHVLFFDDMVGLFSAGKTRDCSLCAADVLRSYFSENRVRLLAEMTEGQLAILRRRDRALADRFHIVRVPAFSSDDALPIVLESTLNAEAEHRCFAHPSCVPLIMRHQEMFAPDKAFPGKAIGMAHTLFQYVTDGVSASDFYQFASNQVGANLDLVLGNLGNQQTIRERIAAHLIGQPAAVDALSKVALQYSQQIQPQDRPVGVLLFLGPTGVGKTEAAKALTRLLYQDDSRLIRIDMNELNSSMAAEQLAGTFEQPDGRLTAAIRRQPNSVILLDEIEKAHPDVFDYLLQVIGEGRLTDARGRTADFRGAIIVMTSNLGAEQDAARLGFDSTDDQRGKAFEKAARQFFRPEFLNRIDQLVAFRKLNAQDMSRIVRLQMNSVLSRDGVARRNVYVRIAPTAIDYVVQTGFDSAYGARSVRRMLERDIIGPLGDRLAELGTQQPVLVDIAARSQAETRPTGQPEFTSEQQLTTRVQSLKIVESVDQAACSSLEELLSRGEELCAQWEVESRELADELNRIDQAANSSGYNASYFGLREQLHRCTDSLEGIRSALQSNSQSQLRFSANSLPTKSSEHFKDAASRVDINMVFDEMNPSQTSRSIVELRREMLHCFALTAGIVQHALSPRDWLFGFTSLTGEAPADLLARGRPNSTASPLRGYDTPADFLHRFEVGLTEILQYETFDTGHPLFLRVSGVGVYGILAPLLGTYRVSAPELPPALYVLQAIPLGDTDVTDFDIRSVIETGACTHESAEQFVMETAKQATIRGCIGTETRDYRSNASLQFSPGVYVDLQVMVTRHWEFWLDCLPIPAALRTIQSDERGDA